MKANAMNFQENHSCISINKFVDLGNSRFAISAFFSLVTTRNHQKRVTMNYSFTKVDNCQISALKPKR